MLNLKAKFIRGLSILWAGLEVFFSFMDKFWQAAGVSMLIGMWGLLLVNAIARWTNLTPIGWSLEITGYMIAWSIFVMMGPVARTDGHIKVTFLPEKLLGQKRGTALAYNAESLVGLFMCIYLAYHSYILVHETYLLHYRVESAGGWYYPMWIVRSGILVGFSFSALYYFERTAKWIKGLFPGSVIASGGNSPMPSGTQVEKSIPEN